MTKSVGVQAAKTHLSRLLEDVQRGEEVLITRRGVVIARLVPPGVSRRQLEADRGRFTIPPDFDGALPADMLDDFER